MRGEIRHLHILDHCVSPKKDKMKKRLDLASVSRLPFVAGATASPEIPSK
jgi:hypothetical protein